MDVLGRASISPPNDVKGTGVGEAAVPSNPPSAQGYLADENPPPSVGPYSIPIPEDLWSS